MKKTIMAALALMMMVMLPNKAAAQITTQQVGGGTCSYCEMCPSIWWHWHHEAAHGDTVLEHADCQGGLCGERVPCTGAALPEDEHRRDRLDDILNTLNGNERIIALVDEFPEQVALADGALEVEGLLCQEGQMIGRLRLTEAQVAFVTGGSTHLAAAF